MKLKSYFLLSIVVGMTFACSSDENVPEVEVFTPDATLSLAAVADGKSLTKAGEGEGENIDQEDAINSLHVMVFYADGNLQIDKVVATNRFGCTKRCCQNSCISKCWNAGKTIWHIKGSISISDGIR